MKLQKWNIGKFDIITLEITFDDGSRKTWDYDALWFNTLGDLRDNMAGDFLEPLENCNEVTIRVKNGDIYHSGVVELPQEVGKNFAEYILGHIEDIE